MSQIWETWSFFLPVPSRSLAIRETHEEGSDHDGIDDEVYKSEERLVTDEDS